ncbi:hypothetical protein [Polycladomyces subterraneus]|uniref:YhfM-like domain-containing protein n=1 Tax=Polycladomyces subterraneus TaxID=1016997 RepID=A0ABT8INK1_9BACL|nr:hypothetical protein [Polycladomyces subterraneus]MDN4594349.1 hypothetical protein [Polycladomyces subterraneus]
MRKFSLLVCFFVILLALTSCTAEKPSEVIIQKANGYETTINDANKIEKIMTIVGEVNWKEGSTPTMARNEDARFWMNDDNKKKETYLIWFGKYGNAELIRDSTKGSAYGTLTADQAKQLKEILLGS